jgi:hypothetical protein
MRYVAVFTILSLLATCLPAGAQTLHGLTIGEDLVPALKKMPKTRDFGQVGNYVAIKWPLADGDSFSATASPATGKIVFLEEDHDSGSSAGEAVLPGLIFGRTTLGDIRKRFGSNGIGFASNAETVQNGAAIGINCYELRNAPKVFVAFVTRLSPPAQIETSSPRTIQTNNGVLVALMVGQKSYLEEIWGTQLLYDPQYRAVDVPGLIDRD